MKTKERKNVKINKEPLFNKLQKAVELELATIPAYLTAVFSMYRDQNREAAAIIRSVFMEEMLHLSLAGNILTAVGGKVKLGPGSIPTYPLRMEFEGKKFRDREFDINLARFEPETIEVFKQIEMPDWGDDLENQMLKANFEVEGYTIGEFYEGIKKELIHLCKRHPDRAVFSGDPDHQITEDYYWGGGGKPIVVNNLKTAIEAIKQIVEQGEGAHKSLWDGDHHNFGQREEVAHYFRFNEIALQRYYKPGDGLKDDPSGEKFEVNYDAVYKIKPNCKAADFENSPELKQLNREFNLKYSMMLKELEEGFNGNPKVFYTAIMNGMHELSPIAYQMVQIPIPGDPYNYNGAPSFEWVEPAVTKVTPGATGPEKDWHIIQTVVLAAPAQAVWDVVGGFYTIHTWHPDISKTEIAADQTEQRNLRRHLTFPGPPVSLTTEQLEFLDNAKLYYKYKWVEGAWGEAVKNYQAEIRVIEMVPGEQCMVQWSSTFRYTSDAVSQFYQNGFRALKELFGTPG